MVKILIKTGPKIWVQLLDYYVNLIFILNKLAPIQFFFLSEVLKKVIGECKNGASARAICTFGDKLIVEETGKVFKKDKQLKKGEYYIINLILNGTKVKF